MYIIYIFVTTAVAVNKFAINNLQLKLILMFNDTLKYILQKEQTKK